MGIKEASMRLQLNYSTAKSILRKYRHTGKILSLKNEFFNDYQKIYQETTAQMSTAVDAKSQTASDHQS